MIQELPSSSGNLIAIRIEGKISKSDVQVIHKRIHEVLDQHSKVDWYMEIQDFEGYELSGLWQDLKVTTKHLQDFGQIAIVGDKKWQEWAAQTADLFTSSDVRFYEVAQQQMALGWVASR